MKLLILTISFSLFASACFAEPLRPPFNTEIECLAAGGMWRKVGLVATKQCVLKTKDAWKPCKDRADCQSDCVADSAAKVGEKSEGHCYGEDVLVGTCLSRIRNGIVQPKICID